MILDRSSACPQNVRKIARGSSGAPEDAILEGFLQED